jgi:hypothetical protein
MGLLSGCGSDDSSAPADSNIVSAGIFSNGLAVCCLDIDQSSHDEQAPQVAFNGTNYLVVYEEGNGDIIGAVVSSSGISIVEIAASSKNEAPRVASDGTNFLVVYQETVSGNNHNIIGKRVDSNGNVLDPNGILIDTSANDDTTPAVVFGGGSYLVVYERDATLGAGSPDHNIIGRFVNPAGAIGAEVQIETSGSDELSPVAAFGGGNFLVVYERDSTMLNPDHDIIGRTVSVLEVVGSEIQIDDTVLDDISPSVASSGADFLVAYERVFSTHDDIRGAVVDTAGTSVSTFDIDASLTTDDRAPAVASNGSQYLVAYQRVLSKDNDIMEAIVDTTGIPSVTLNPVDTSDSDYVAPAIASDGSNYFVVFEEVF